MRSDAVAASFASWSTLDPATRQTTIAASGPGCRSATDAIKQSAASLGCQL